LEGSGEEGVSTGRMEGEGGRPDRGQEPRKAEAPGPGGPVREAARGDHEGRDGSSEVAEMAAQHRARCGLAGPPAWLEEARSYMQDSSPARRKEALSFVLQRVFSATAEGGGAERAPVVHKAVLRAVSSMLMDGALTVREEARGTLDKLSTYYPQVRSLCVKYAGQQLTPAVPPRMRLFLIDTIKLFVLDALALLHASGRNPSSAGSGNQARTAGEGAPESERSFWFEGCRVAGRDALQTYIEAEQAAANYTVYQHEEHGLLVERGSSNAGSALEVFVAASGELLWSRAAFLVTS
jgi:hypothetical protein